MISMISVHLVSLRFFLNRVRLSLFVGSIVSGAPSWSVSFCCPFVGAPPPLSPVLGLVVLVGSVRVLLSNCCVALGVFSMCWLP